MAIMTSESKKQIPALCDAFGRSITYLRVSLTDRCNYRCLYCMPQTHEPDFASSEEVLTYEELEKILFLFAEKGVQTIRVTGGEPLARRDAGFFLESLLARRWFEEISLSTNGHYFASWAERLARAGLRRVNISLDSLDKEKFRAVTKFGDVAKVVEAIDAALAAGLDPVKINTVLLRNFNACEVVSLARFALDRGAHLRFIELMPVGGDGFFGPENFYPLAEARAQLERAFHLKHLEGENAPRGRGPARYVGVEGYRATLGFIGALTCNFCAQCNRMRLSAAGRLYPCLDHDDVFIDLREPLRAGASQGELSALLAEALRVKPQEHTMTVARGFVTHRSMSAIGG